MARKYYRRNKIKKIYAEWILYGEFHNGFFTRWEDYFAATFNPDCEILIVKEIE